MKKVVTCLLLAFLLVLCACTEEEAPKTSDIGGEIQSGPDGTGNIPTFSPPSAQSMFAASKGFTVIDEEVSTIADGVTLNTLTLESGKAYVIVASLAKCELTVSTPYNTKPYGTNQSLEGQAEGITLDGKEVLCGMSASPMNLSINEPLGVIVKGGEVIYDRGYNDGSVFFGIYEDGLAFAATYSEYEEIYRNKVNEAVCGSQLLVLDGEMQTVYGDDGARANRIAAGLTAYRDAVVLVYAENVTAQELSCILVMNYCSRGVALISGDLACMLIGEESVGSRTPVGPSLFITKRQTEDN